MKSYVSIDLETTGLNPKLDKIIEIGAVKVVEGEIVERFSTLVNPGRLLEEHTAALTGISDEELKSAPYIEEVLPRLLSFLEDYDLVGHSLLFDFSFLKKAAINQKMTFERKGVDTLKIARRFLTALEHKTLEFLCLHFEIPHRAHRALADAEATHCLYQKLAAEYYNSEDTLFVPQPLIYKVKKDGPASKRQKERLYDVVARHKLELTVDIEKLTKSEASRLTDVLRFRGFA